MVAWSLLAACTGSGSDSGAAAAPYLLDEEELPTASMSTETLGGLLDDAVALARTLSADPVFEAYNTVMLGAEAGCPATWTYNGERYWSDDCVATDGTHFTGYAFHTLHFNELLEDGSIYDGETFSGVVEITTPEGRVFSGGGDAWDLATYAAEGTTWESGTTGAFGWDGAEAAGTWLETTVVPELTMTVAQDTAGTTSVAIDGGLTGAEGVDVVVFDALTLFTAAGCPTEPAAVLSVRDSAGDWYDVIFDGPDAVDTVVAAEDCDGCGAAWFGGEHLGEVCVDFTPLTDWEGAPWD